MRAQLAKKIETALRLMISTHSDKAKEEYNSPAVKAEMKAFHQDRIKEIIGGNTPISLPPGGKVILHVILTPAYYDERFTDVISSLASGGHIPVPHLGVGHGGIRKTDFGGFVNSNEGVPAHMLAYAKMFRTGAIEELGMLRPNDTGGGYYIFGPVFANQIMTAVTRNLELLKHYDAGSPVCIMLTFAGGEYRLAHEAMGSIVYKKIIDPKPTVTMPPVYAESYDADVFALMRTPLNVLWNAFGFPACDMYVGGKYIGVIE